MTQPSFESVKQAVDSLNQTGSSIIEAEMLHPSVGIMHSQLVVVGLVPLIEELDVFLNGLNDQGAEPVVNHKRAVGEALAAFMGHPGGTEIDFTCRHTIAHLMNLTTMISAAFHIIHDENERAHTTAAVQSTLVDTLCRKVTELGGESALDELLKSLGAVRVNSSNTH